MPVFPGQLRYIRKNLFHAVYVLDPATVCGLEACFISVVLILFFFFQPFFRIILQKVFVIIYLWSCAGYRHDNVIV